MRTQASESLAAWPAELVAPHGILVLSGYSLGVRVWRGRLRVADGIGHDRREAIVHRATGRLRRLVVLGHTGAVTLEAIRWLADVGVGYLQVDADGRVLAAFGPLGTDRPSLRRAQASALDTPLGNGIVRRLLAEKVAGQAATLAALTGVGSVTDETVQAVRLAAERLHIGVTRDDLRLAEAQAAAAYWSAWTTVPFRLARHDADRVPEHWRTFGSRTSPLTGGPRLAGNPANAILNYLYALLEGEASIAARIVGLDPGLGVLHADQLNRDSLSADLMEPVRPQVDRYVLDLLGRRTFAARDFFETRQGVCRVTPPLTHELAETTRHWGRLVGRVAEDVARALENRAPERRTTPTPVSGRRRGARFGKPLNPSAAEVGVPRASTSCSICGKKTGPGRRTCSDACEGAARAGQDLTPFLTTGVEKLRQLRARGIDPVRAPKAIEKLRASQSARQAEENAWNAAHPERPDPEVFRREILPLLADAPASRLARETGLSVGYCARVKKGVEVPHPRWWEPLKALIAQASATSRRTSSTAASISSPEKDAESYSPASKK